MTADEKYGILIRAATIVSDKADRAALLAHHDRIEEVIKGMLMSRKRRQPRESMVTKDNPTGNPFKHMRKASPVAVSSALDRSMASRRAASDAPEASFD